MEIRIKLLAFRGYRNNSVFPQKVVQLLQNHGNSLLQTTSICRVIRCLEASQQVVSNFQNIRNKLRGGILHLILKITSQTFAKVLRFRLRFEHALISRCGGLTKTIHLLVTRFGS